VIRFHQTKGDIYSRFAISHKKIQKRIGTRSPPSRDGGERFRERFRQEETV